LVMALIMENEQRRSSCTCFAASRDIRRGSERNLDCYHDGTRP
jgi:hypothetical protein